MTLLLPLLLLLSVAALGSAAPTTYDSLFYLIEGGMAIGAHNANPNRTFDMGLHPIGLLSPSEYKQLLGFRYTENRPKPTRTFQMSENIQAPDSFDWRDHGAVSPVKNQGTCGTCWAFSAVGALEGQHAIKKGALVQFSEQQLLDCDYEDGGCQGGLPDSAFKFVNENGGIETEEAYPYHARKGECQFDKEKVAETDNGFVDIPSGDEEALKNAVATVGPISVGIDASAPSFQYYKTGKTIN